jgi:hypothetical protein
MKNLTENQQEIIDLITNEFVLINEKKATETDDIFAYIDSSVNEKKLYAEEMKQRNTLYENVIVEKCNDIEYRILNIVERYGYGVENYHTSKSCNLIHYTELRIYFGNDKYQSLYLYTKIEDKENIDSYANTDIRIYQGYRREGEIQDANLEKFVADLIIKQLKNQIK